MTEQAAVGRLRRLALVVEPLPGEGLVSWLGAMADAYGVSRNAVARATGIVRKPTDGQRLTEAVFDPSGAAADLWTTCRLTPEQVTGLTYHRFRGTALAPLGEGWIPTTSRQSVEGRWINPHRMRLCPLCAAEGNRRWPLAWTLPWAFACTVHRCYLADRCPRCERPFSLTTNPAGGICRTRILEPDIGWCQMPLREIPAVPVTDDYLLRLQQVLLEHLDAPEAERPSAHKDFTDLRAMALMALYTATSDHLPGADEYVVDGFARFCDDNFLTHGRLLSYEERVSPTVPVLTAVVRIAADIVFCADPLEAADAVANFTAEPHSPAIVALRRAWNTGPLSRGDRDTSARLAAVMDSLRYDGPGFSPNGYTPYHPSLRR
ncbi:TniQ family protein [Streptomyces sp. NPDC001667]